MIIFALATLIAACGTASAPSSSKLPEKIEGIGVTQGTIPTPLPPEICPQADLEIDWDFKIVSLVNSRQDCEVHGVQLTIYPLSAPTVEILDHKYIHFPIDLSGGENRTLSIHDEFYDWENRRCRYGRSLDECPIEDLLVPIFDTSLTGEIGCVVKISVPRTPPRECHPKPNVPSPVYEIHLVSTTREVVEQFKVETGEIPLNAALLERIGVSEEKLTTIYESWNIIDPSPSLPVDPNDNSITISFWDEDPRIPQLDTNDLEILSEISLDLHNAPDGFSSLNSWRPEFVERGVTCDAQYRVAAEKLTIAIQKMRNAESYKQSFIASATSLRSAQACLGKRVPKDSVG